MNKLFKKQIAIMGISCFVCAGFGMERSYAQTTNKFWSLLTLYGNYGDFLYNLEPQLRLRTNLTTFNQFLINGSGGYQVSPEWQIWLGQALTTTSQDSEPSNLEEYRFWEQAVWQHKLNSIGLTSRTRLEQRKSFDFPDWANRFRERIWFNVPLTEQFAFDLANEVLINVKQVQWINTKFWDQNRLYVGFSQQLTPSVKVFAGYMNQWIFTAVTQSDRVFLVNVQVNLS